MSNTKTGQGHYQVIKRWHAAGYKADSVAVALRMKAQTVRNLAQMLELGAWGHKSLSQRILDDLVAMPDLPPNLEGKYQQFLRMWGPGWKLGISALAMGMGGFNEDRLETWVAAETKRLKARSDIKRIDYRLCKTQ